MEVATAKMLDRHIERHYCRCGPEKGRIAAGRPDN
jgi:hypothetical protein